jgi:aldehyde dehydrogenase (NAD+)
MHPFASETVQIPSGHFIGGRIRIAAEGLAVRRPSDGQVHGGLPLATAEVVDEAVRDAHAAWTRGDWARRAPRERARVLRRWADLIEADVARLAPLEAVCSTRPVRDAAAWDVPFTAEGLRFFAEYCDKLGGEVAATRHDHLGMVVSEPYGVIGAITP